MPIFFLCNSNLGSMSFPPIHQPLGSIHSQGCWCTFHPLHHYFCPYHFCMVPLVWPLGPPWCTKVNNTEKAGRESRPYFVASCRHQLGWIWFFTNGCSPLWRCTRSHLLTILKFRGSQRSQLRATLQVCLCNKNARGWTWWPKTAFLIKQFWSKRGWGRFRQTTSMTCWSLIFTAVGLDVC